MIGGLTGRAALVVLAAFALAAPSCRRTETDHPTVVLYSSADPDVVNPVIAAFTKGTGIEVLLVGDTEATKSTGLVQRLIAEKARPRADVWWSSEALGTVDLARAGVLSPCGAGPGDDRPAGLRGEGDLWRGLASRPRVVVYNTNAVESADAPRRLGALTGPRFRGRLGMARPQFGTTRGQMAALLAAHGEPAFRAWLAALKANGVRLYDGNMAVVRACAQGEIDAGLTDTDDVYAGQRNGWPVAMAEAGSEIVPGTDPTDGDRARPFPRSALGTPNTVALIAGAPHAEAARALLAFLLAQPVEKILVEGEAHAVPSRESTDPAGHWERIAAAAADAMRVCAEVLE